MYIQTNLKYIWHLHSLPSSTRITMLRSALVDPGGSAGARPLRVSIMLFWHTNFMYETWCFRSCRHLQGWRPTANPGSATDLWAKGLIFRISGTFNEISHLKLKWHFLVHWRWHHDNMHFGGKWLIVQKFYYLSVTRSNAYPLINFCLLKAYCAQNYPRWQHSCSVHSFPAKIACCHDVTFVD